MVDEQRQLLEQIGRLLRSGDVSDLRELLADQRSNVDVVPIEIDTAESGSSVTLHQTSSIRRCRYKYTYNKDQGRSNPTQGTSNKEV